MVIGELGVPGEDVLKHVDLEQEQDPGAATAPPQRMGGNTAVDQAACQGLATHKLVQVKFETFTNILVMF